MIRPGGVAGPDRASLFHESSDPKAEGNSPSVCVSPLKTAESDRSSGTPDLSIAVWRRFYVGHGRAVGPHGLADRPRRNAWRSRTLSVSGGGMHLNHARTVLGLSPDWPLLLVARSLTFLANLDALWKVVQRLNGVRQQQRRLARVTPMTLPLSRSVDRSARVPLAKYFGVLH